jgi:hypothetical protein
MRRVKVSHPSIPALVVCLALGVAACGGGGSNTASSPKPEGQPMVVTGPSSNVNENDAQVKGTVNPNDQPSTTYYFEYGTTTSYGSKTPPKPVSGNTDQSLTAKLSNLDPDTTYHYQLVAQVGSGTMVKGGDQTFTTPAAGGGGGEGGGGGGGANNNNGTTGKATTGGTTTGKTTGYTTTPPPSTGGYTTTPPPSTGGYTTTPPPSTGGYTTTPPPSTGQ